MPLETGTLWDRLHTTTQAAIACGALHRIETEAETLEQDGLRFVVRVASNLKRKSEDQRKRMAARPSGGAEYNPFLPPEPELTVGQITDSHLAVLNKFNVVQHHLLIVTREFVHQETLLDEADFTALWRCLPAYPSLGFYNGGTAAGASQRHKHLQLVPLPLYEGQQAYPFEDLYAAATGDGIQCLPALPFDHAWCRLPGELVAAEKAATESWRLYRRMLQRVGIRGVERVDGEYQSAPYNLLMTHNWMLLVPRSREFSQGISVNALGYVGSLFVKDRAGLEVIRETGPRNLLREVSILP